LKELSGVIVFAGGSRAICLAGKNLLPMGLAKITSKKVRRNKKIPDAKNRQSPASS
jgi:hypothetical protein